jgi:hypothetical protein
VIRLGFLGGKPGLIFHVLQRFWFRFLVDAKIYELRQKEGRGQAASAENPADGSKNRPSEVKRTPAA